MKYHNITHDDMLNGDGLRVVLWVSGCEHHCEGCQNPVTWDPEDGLDFDESALNEIFEQLDKDYISGLTITGGDPLYSAIYSGDESEILSICKKVKEKYPNKTIWIYTGYDWIEITHLKLLKYIDVLVDGRFEKDKKDENLQWKGSSNQRVIDVKKTLASEDNKIILYSEDYSKDHYVVHERMNCGCCN